MATITEWLASLGLSEYAQRFGENDIDVSVLRHLTDQDLKEIGVSLGHRRKILALDCRTCRRHCHQVSARSPTRAEATRRR